MLKNIIKDLSGNCHGLFVTGSTGIAATKINGSTIHRFSGIGTGTKSAHELVACIKTDEHAVQRWRSCLVIDEISMISKELFEKLELVARSINENNKPFGGVQLILSGDFFTTGTCYT